MSPRAIDTLAGKDAVVFDLLTRIVRYGQHTGRFTAADVGRVCAAHLPRPRGMDPRAQERIMALTARAEDAEHRADEAERRANRRRRGDAVLWKPPDLPDHTRVVALARREAEVITGLAIGKTTADIAAEVGSTIHAVDANVARAVRAIGAANKVQAVAWLLTGKAAVATRVLGAHRNTRQMRRVA